MDAVTLTPGAQDPSRSGVADQGVEVAVGGGPGIAAARILVVDDDATVSEVLTKYLLRAGHAVEVVSDGKEGRDTAIFTRPDLIVLDLMLPSMDGIEVFRQIREKHSAPVVMLTARGEEEDRILGLEIGADDYVTKPFSPREVVLRIESILRRSKSEVIEPVSKIENLDFGRLRVDIESRRVTVDGSRTELTLKEFDLLGYLCMHPGKAFRREELLEAVWGWSFGDTATVTVHIRRVREKIEEDPSDPRLITTVWGVGYRFDG